VSGQADVGVLSAGDSDYPYELQPRAAHPPASLHVAVYRISIAPCLIVSTACATIGRAVAGDQTAATLCRNVISAFVADVGGPDPPALERMSPLMGEVADVRVHGTTGEVVRGHPAFTLVTGCARRNHEVLHQKRLIAPETESVRNLRL